MLATLCPWLNGSPPSVRHEAARWCFCHRNRNRRRGSAFPGGSLRVGAGQCLDGAECLDLADRGHGQSAEVGTSVPGVWPPDVIRRPAWRERQPVGEGAADPPEGRTSGDPSRHCPCRAIPRLRIARPSGETSTPPGRASPKAGDARQAGPVLLVRNGPAVPRTRFCIHAPARRSAEKGTSSMHSVLFSTMTTGRQPGLPGLRCTARAYRAPPTPTHDAPSGARTWPPAISCAASASSAVGALGVYRCPQDCR